MDFDTVYLAGKPYTVEDARVQKTCVLMKLAGVDSVEAAARLRDVVVEIDRDDAELPEGSMFIQDLIGLPVLCEGKTLGKVKEILQLPANDVYVVEGEQEYMIPGRAGVHSGAQSGRGVHPRAAAGGDAERCGLTS